MGKKVTAATIIGRTLKLFSEDHKWIKGNWVDKQNGVVCYCLDGGLNFCATRDGHLSEGPNAQALVEAKQIVLSAIEKRKSYKPKMGGIIGWNDEKDRTVSQIRSVLASALKLAA